MAQNVSSQIDRSGITGGNGTVDRDDLSTPHNNTVTVINNILNYTQQVDGLLMKELGSNPATPASGSGIVFCKSDGFYHLSDGGTLTGPFTAIPANAPFITQTPVTGLSAEQAMSASATGLVKNTTGTGVLSIAVAGTDYQLPIGILDCVDEQPQNTAPNTYTAGSWQTVPYNFSGNTLGTPGLSFDDTNNTVTPSAGVYKVNAWLRMRTGASAGHFALRLARVSNGATMLRSPWHYVPANTHETLRLTETLVFSTSFAIRLEVYAGAVTSTTNMAANITSDAAASVELYSRLTMTKVANL